MEHEIGNVAAACAMRGFRYLAFPPVVFEPLAVEMEPPDRAAATVDVLAAGAASLAPDVGRIAVTPFSAAVRSLAMGAMADRPAVGTIGAGPAAPAHERGFALLAEVSAELRRHASP